MKKKALLELIWWIFTFIVALGVLLPVYLNTTAYPFYIVNLVYIITFITLTRYIFLLEYTFLARRPRIMLILFFLFIPFVFYLGQELNYFQTFLDEEGAHAVIGSDQALSAETSILRYVRNEMILFGVGSIISGVIFPFRLMVSIWRFRNRSAV